MLSSFAIRNFRCFHHLTLDDFGRVNLIGGRNNAGKTALLEAVYLHYVPDKPQQWVDISRLRGIQRGVLATQALAKWLFRRHSDSPIDARSCDVEGIERSTEVYLVDLATSRDKFPSVEESIAKRFGAEFAGSDALRLILRFRTGGKQGDAVILLEKTRYASIPAPVPGKISTVFLGCRMSDRERDVTRFGELESAKRLEEIMPSLQIIEPRLQRLSLVPFAGGAEIHGDVEGMSRLVPLPLIGEGMRRLLSMVLAIANVPGGIVLIDEIENGLHYSVLPNVWKALADAARRNDVQVFAATHSWECLRAAHEAFCREEPYGFRYYRLDREDGEATCVAYDREMIETSLTMGMEAR